MRRNLYSATAIMAASAFALLAVGCDDDGLLDPAGDTYNAEAVAALDPESPERWRAEYNQLLAENPDVMQLHRRWFDDDEESSEFFRTWEPPAQRSRCGNGRATEEIVAAIVAAIEARAEGGTAPPARLAAAIDQYIGIFGRGS
ncbi:MAG: hypothetical protein OXH51_10585 [Gemmatimonadetes bacterium]|nr:hypothetical protein [Gemmatimonadota bacterium]MCY3611969.1 hypothetical protein [Gemmatimonadota bacterium]MCY3679271.1 hypothetical protein [Gemmatimonadota bacterium]